MVIEKNAAIDVKRTTTFTLLVGAGLTATSSVYQHDKYRIIASLFMGELMATDVVNRTSG